MITGLHTTYSQGFYKAERNLGLKVSEDIGLVTGTDLRALRPRFDNKDSVYIGYGYDLLDIGKSVQQIKNDLNAVGVTLTPHDETWLTDYRNGSTTITKAFLVQQAKANAFTTNLGSEPVAAALLTDVLDDRYEPILTARLAQFGIVLPDSRERAALVSLAYANPTRLLGNKLMSAIATGNRAEAWYEIRYNSNGEGLVTAGGTATRRFYESELFGLYGDGVNASTISEVEAKEVFRMYTQHRDAINTYESRFGQNGTSQDRVLEAASRYGLQVGYWSQESQKARDFLITNYAQFAAAPPIDGEVLVGSNIGNADSVPGNDLLLGEARYNNLHGQGGDDVLYGNIVGDDLFGDAGNDVLFGDGGDDTLQGGDDNDRLEGGQGKDRLVGGAGIDTLRGGTEADRLIGGTGDDLLEGGDGFDTYLYTTGDGHDRIEDSDANGVIIVNGQTLAGGVKKAGHTDWISADGTLKYVMQGTDLVVKLNDVTILTVNENFQSGQFGIQLIDAPTTSTSLPTTTRTIVGDYQPLDVDPEEEGIQIDYDELGNILQDLENPNDRSDMLRVQERMAA